MKVQLYGVFMLGLALAEVPPLAQILLLGADATQVSPWFDPQVPAHRGRPFALVYAAALGVLLATRAATAWRPRLWVMAVLCAAVHAGELLLFSALAAQQGPAARARQEGAERSVPLLLAAIAAGAAITLGRLPVLARAGRRRAVRAETRREADLQEIRRKRAENKALQEEVRREVREQMQQQLRQRLLEQQQQQQREVQQEGEQREKQE